MLAGANGHATPVLLAWDGAIAGMITVADRPREAARAMTEIDQHHHVAWVARPADERTIIGDARYVRRTDSADAEFAIDYAYSAIEEAEYAVLDAILARRDAEEAAVAANR